MIILKKYRIDTFGDEQHIVVTERIRCPDCGGRLRPRGTARRKIRDLYGEVQVYHVQRVRCTVCGAFHTALPDFIVPHKHYSKEAIDQAVECKFESKLSACAAETETIRLWAKERLRQMESEKKSE